MRLSDIAYRVLTNFEQHAACARRVDEEVEMAAGSDLNVFGNEAGALGFQGLKGSGDVFDMQRDVVETFAAPGEEASDGRSFARRFEQLDARFAGGDHGGADLFLLDGFFVDDSEAEGLIELAGLRDAFDGDADVVKFGHENQRLEFRD
jgi:hypothetical protein